MRGGIPSLVESWVHLDTDRATGSFDYGGDTSAEIQDSSRTFTNEFTMLTDVAYTWDEDI